jgi:hypothetical protein
LLCFLLIQEWKDKNTHKHIAHERLLSIFIAWLR